MQKIKIRMDNKFFVSVVTVVLGIFVCGLVILISGYNPFSGIGYLFAGGFKNLTRVCNTLAFATPMILTGLSFAFAFRSGLFNIGMPGQMLIGGCMGLIFSVTFPSLPKIIMIPCVVFVSMFAGAVWGAVPGAMKVKFNVSEVVTTIMMNWIAYWYVYYTILLKYKSRNIDIESVTIPASASMKIPLITRLTGDSNINIGLLFALLCVGIVWFILDRTVMGYEMKAVGYNRYSAQYSGISVGKRVLQAMAISGALSGLAGATYYLGYTSRIVIGVMPAAGWNGIAVSLLACNSAIGIVFSAILLGAMFTGQGFMTAMTGIPSEVSDILIAIIIYFSAASILIGNYLDSIGKMLDRRKKESSEKKIPKTDSREDGGR